MNEEDIEKIVYLDLYEILDISKDSYDKKKLKKNYKKLVLVLHPDKKGGDSEAFELVNLAYSILKDKTFKKLYDKKRKEHLNSRDFNDLKSDNTMQFISSIPDDEDSAKINFKILEEQLNKKHNFDEKDLNAISSSEMSKRLQNLNFSRGTFDENYKNTVQKVHYNKEDFNTAFINQASRDTQNNTEIIAYNSQNSQISKYTSINNFDLYSDKGASTKTYSSLDKAFNNQVPSNVTNSYNSHNYVTNEDIQEYNRRMSQHLTDIRRNN